MTEWAWFLALTSAGVALLGLLASFLFLVVGIGRRNG